MKRHKQEPKNYSLLPIVCKSTTFYFFIQNFIFQSEIFIRGIKKTKTAATFTSRPPFCDFLDIRLLSQANEPPTQPLTYKLYITIT